MEEVPAADPEVVPEAVGGDPADWERDTFLDDVDSPWAALLNRTPPPAPMPPTPEVEAQPEPEPEPAAEAAEPPAPEPVAEAPAPGEQATAPDPAPTAEQSTAAEPASRPDPRYTVGRLWPEELQRPAEPAPIVVPGPLFPDDLPDAEDVGGTVGRRRHLPKPPDWTAPYIKAALVALALAVVASAFGAIALLRAASAARDGQRNLAAAEAALGRRDTDEARARLEQARSAFQRGSTAVNLAGPLLLPARALPLVRVQVLATDRFLDAGVGLSEAGLEVAEALDAVVHARTAEGPVTAVIKQLEPAGAALAASRTSLDRAIEQLADLDGYRLLGPLGSTRLDLARRVPVVQERLDRAQQAVAALGWFTGAEGPRSYLVFTQNPDEVRPTGGFIGTYGLLKATGGELTLDRFASIESWYAAHPDAAVPPEAVPSPLRFPTPNRQTLANVNATPDWRAAADLAARLWEQGGEPPVHGALSVTPAFLARLLGVLGPVDVPDYGERITAENLVERTDFYTHQQDAPVGGDRKDFLVALAPLVLDKLVHAPASAWDELGVAVAEGFQRREAMAWSRDKAVADALVTNRWDGMLPEGPGDFFYQADFQYSAKSGRGIRRHHVHRVALNANGSGRVATTTSLTLTGADAAEGDSFSYVTVYGPQGARIDTATAEEAVALEPPLAGHPGAAYLRSAGPDEPDELRTGWVVPRLLQQNRDGSMTYRLRWMALPDHSGDTVALTVSLPKGWRWRDKGPPRTIALDQDFEGAWVLERS